MHSRVFFARRDFVTRSSDWREEIVEEEVGEGEGEGEGVSFVLEEDIWEGN